MQYHSHHSYKSIAELHTIVLLNKRKLYEKYGVENDSLLLFLMNEEDRQRLKKLNNDFEYLKKFGDMFFD